MSYITFHFSAPVQLVSSPDAAGFERQIILRRETNLAKEFAHYSSKIDTTVQFRLMTRKMFSNVDS